MELVAVVIGRQPGVLLIGQRVEIHRRLGGIGEVFLPAGDKGLLEPRPGAFPSDQDQPVVQPEDPVGVGGAQPLELGR